MSGVVFASGGVLSASIAAALYVVDSITRATKVSAFDAYNFTPFELNIPAEDVRVPVTDGDTLAGWWLPRPETKRVILVCYGYRNRKSDMLGIGAAMWRHGYNVLIFDYHGHGEHAGTRVTLGYRELDDALAAVRYIFGRLPDAMLGTIGFSMGASVAIMAAARDARIMAVVADSPFAAQRNPISRRVRQAKQLSWFDEPILFFADHFLYWLLGYRFHDVEPVRDIKKLGERPILLIHGMRDSVIDPADSESLFRAAIGPKDIWLLEGAEHCGAYFADRPVYVRKVLGFFDAALRRDRVRGPAVEKVVLKEQEQHHNQQQHEDYDNNGRPRVVGIGARLFGLSRGHVKHSPPSTQN
jgi:alpha-beta hydrolase superfamily lysophospholipase